ncbi:hypothetical protein ALC60_02157 [Trachymyrmex zeteki]|uniref:Uncharacterized protein n=1 Tax=Mycetomoellerius zeteki TaxID=64791 RepID=A0A151XEM4_9HYME|nr:hypothetical protein ALC60_02157 [Trachymyrmex zeteki]
MHPLEENIQSFSNVELVIKEIRKVQFKTQSETMHRNGMSARKPHLGTPRPSRYTSRRRVLVAAAATTTTTTSLSSIASLFRAGLHAVYIVNSFPFSYTSPFGAVNWIAFTGSNIQSEKYTTAACQLPPLPALFVGLPLPPSPSLSAAAVAAAAASSPSPRSRPPPPRALASPLSFSRACEIPIRGNFIYIHRPRRSRASVCHDA